MQHSLQLYTSMLSNTFYPWKKIGFFSPWKNFGCCFFLMVLIITCIKSFTVGKAVNRSFQILFDPWWQYALNCWNKIMFRISIWARALKTTAETVPWDKVLKDWSWVKSVTEAPYLYYCSWQVMWLRCFTQAGRSSNSPLKWNNPLDQETREWISNVLINMYKCPVSLKLHIYPL